MKCKEVVYIVKYCLNSMIRSSLLVGYYCEFISIFE